MDKLEPILKQKFWIILGIGVILTVTGWWMATGSLAATIAQRKDAIKKAEDSIPKDEVPNSDWSTKLSQINNRQEAMVAEVRRAMWERQAATYFWPLHVDEFAKDAPYRSEFDLTARELYRTNYLANAEEVWKRVRPINPLDGSGIVMFPFQSMPQKKFGELAPRSDEIWDAQEDLWLLAPILDAIREVNGGESGTRLDAVVHVINKLELMGGERNLGDGGAASSGGMPANYGGDGGAAGDDAAGMVDYGGDSGGGFGGAMGGAGSAAPKVSADFPPSEEFGTSGMATGGGMGAGLDLFGEAAFGGDTSGGQASAPTVRRYVDDQESLPYKTRGFYLSVTMDHRKVPILLGELTANGNSPWPIEIVRVQIARLNPDDREGRSLGGGMVASSPYGGAGPMGPMGEAGYPEGGGNPTSEDYSPNYGDVGGTVGGYGAEYGAPGAAAAGTGGLSFSAALSDPFMARVALCGLIYIYKPVTAPPADSTSQPAEQPVVTEAAAPADPVAAEPQPGAPEPVAEGTPAEPAAAATPGEPQPAPAAPSETPAPAATDPAPAEPAPAEPASTPPPAAESPPN